MRTLYRSPRFSCCLINQKAQKNATSQPDKPSQLIHKGIELCRSQSCHVLPPPMCEPQLFSACFPALWAVRHMRAHSQSGRKFPSSSKGPQLSNSSASESNAATRARGSHLSAITTHFSNKRYVSYPLEELLKLISF